MTEEKIHLRREWLEPDNAHVLSGMTSHVTVDSYEHDERTIASVSGSVTMSDCSDSINWGFHVYDHDDAVDAVAKIDRAISHLIAFREGLLRGIEQVRPHFRAKDADT